MAPTGWAPIGVNKTTGEYIDLSDGEDEVGGYFAEWDYANEWVVEREASNPNLKVLLVPVTQETRKWMADTARTDNRAPGPARRPDWVEPRA